MKITVLAENTSLSPEYIPEHGLSFLIETEKDKILFDMGQSNAFLKNAAHMRISLHDVDFGVLSHGHYDHGGGLVHFLKTNDHAPIYISQYAFRDYYNAENKYIGLDSVLSLESRIHLTGNIHKINQTCTLFSCNDFCRPYPAAPHGLKEKCGVHFYEDRFLHEQYLLIQEKGKRILISGCSHKGILNILEWFRPDVLIGGFHLMKTDTESPEGLEMLDRIATHLKKSNSLFYTGHCTGRAAFDFLKARLSDQLSALSTGLVISI